ncbi:MAG: threonine synthase [Alphaproteobacteria bacterium]|nr:threonine synthase [Alphaproteobacteria bacterium]
MRYISTRHTKEGGGPAAIGFDDVLLAGLARDGGLYVPERWPALKPQALEALAHLDYPSLAARVLAPFTAGAVDEPTLLAMAKDAYAGFDHPATAPLVQLAPNRWLLELFHGPTLAFKDFALQLLGRLFDHVLAKRGERLTIVGATSGDTGSAAIAACHGRANLSVFILHPHGRVSEVQRRQMTTVLDDNVHNIAIDGTFDDCQTLVKAMFNDLAFRDQLSLGAINSINWARIAAQLVYYFYAALRLGASARPVAFVVPTGNFGNVYAGYAARQMGLPIKRLHVATNVNDILARFFASGAYAKAGVTPSVSPSMDIEVASNFERLLFELHGGDGAAVRRLMDQLDTEGRFSVGALELQSARQVFRGHRADDDAALRAIARTYKETGVLIDPHTAAGITAADDAEEDVPLICLATAHPAKFPEAVERATGITPKLPERLADLLERPERATRLPNDVTRIKDFVRSHAGVGDARRAVGSAR